jgi:hypothetical protein
MKAKVIVAVVVMLLTGWMAGTCQGEEQKIQVQAVIDGLSELVITPQGLYWHNVDDHAKPGNYGTGYSLSGPTYVNGDEWTPTWAIPGNPRVEDISSLYTIGTSGFVGFTLSQQYDGYFDNYIQFVGDDWLPFPLGSLLDLNRGVVSLSEYQGYSAIRLCDSEPGQMVYSFDIILPEPATLSLLALGGLAMMRRWGRK